MAITRESIETKIMNLRASLNTPNSNEKAKLIAKLIKSEQKADAIYILDEIVKQDPTIVKYIPVESCTPKMMEVLVEQYGVKKVSSRATEEEKKANRIAFAKMYAVLSPEQKNSEVVNKYLFDYEPSFYQMNVYEKSLTNRDMAISKGMINYVPDKQLTKEVLFNAVKNNNLKNFASISEHSKIKLANHIKNEKIAESDKEFYFERLIKNDPTFIAFVPAEYVTEAAMNVVMSANGVVTLSETATEEQKINNLKNAEILYAEKLTEDQRKNDKIVGNILNRTPALYLNEGFKKTKENSKVAYQHGMFKDIPQKYRTSELVTTALSSNKALEYFPMLSKKDRKNKNNIQTMIANNHIDYNDVESVRKNFINLAGKKYLQEKAEILIERNPRLLFAQKQNKDGTLETIFPNYVPKSKQQPYLSKAFKLALGRLDFETFVGEIPAKALTNQNALEFVKECQIHDLNNRGLNKPASENDKTYLFIKNLDLSKLNARAILNEAVGTNPNVLDVVKKDIRDKALSGHKGQKIFFKAIAQDPTYIKYGQTPLTPSQKCTVLQASIAQLSKPGYDANKKQQLQEIVLDFLGVKESNMEFELPNGEGTVKLSDLRNEKALSNRQMKKVFNMLAETNPEILIECASNPEIAKMPFFQKALAKAVRNHEELVPELVEKQVANYKEEYDRALKDKESLEKEEKTISKEIAEKEIELEFQSYDKKEKTKDNYKSALETETAKLNMLKEKISELKNTSEYEKMDISEDVLKVRFEEEMKAGKVRGMTGETAYDKFVTEAKKAVEAEIKYKNGESKKEPKQFKYSMLLADNEYANELYNQIRQSIYNEEIARVQGKIDEQSNVVALAQDSYELSEKEFQKEQKKFDALLQKYEKVFGKPYDVSSIPTRKESIEQRQAYIESLKQAEKILQKEIKNKEKELDDSYNIVQKLNRTLEEANLTAGQKIKAALGRFFSSAKTHLATGLIKANQTAEKIIDKIIPTRPVAEVESLPPSI